jgi:hypothetical protein
LGQIPIDDEWAAGSSLVVSGIHQVDLSLSRASISDLDFDLHIHTSDFVVIRMKDIVELLMGEKDGRCVRATSVAEQNK